MKTLKRSKLFSALILVCISMIAPNLQAQRKELRTESDGFQWCLCSDNSHKWIELVNGQRITNPNESRDVDWNESGYIVSHKVFYIKNITCPPGCLAAPREGGVYTTQGVLLTRGSWAPFSFSFQDHGIIIASKYGKSGVYYNNRIIVPFESYKNYDISYIDGCYLASTKDSKYSEEYALYTNDGTLIGSEITGYDNVLGTLYFTMDGNTYNKNKQKIASGRILKTAQNTSGQIYLITSADEYYIKYGSISHKNLGLFDLEGNEILPNQYNSIIIEGDVIVVKDQSDKYGLFDLFGNQLIPANYQMLTVDSDNQVIKVKNSENKYGLFNIDGKEILSPEFEDCELIAINSIKFRINGYWGVMKKTGSVYIPTSRQYTKIEYNKTLKTFYFEKEDGSKGECNANGVQTSISKPKETVANNTTTTKTPSSTSNSKGTNGTSSSTSKATSNSNEPGLLYRGEYTISEDVGTLTEIFSIYEDRITAPAVSFAYKSTTASGDRIYSGDGLFGVFWKFTVSPNYNIRLTKTYPNPYGMPTTVNCRVTKGQSSLPVQNGGGYYEGTGGYDNNFGGNTGGNSGGNTNTQTKTHKCGLCNGTGRVIETNGTSFGNTKYCSECGKTVPDSHYHTTCPSCKGKGYW